MFADYLKKPCPNCGAYMRPLANTLFCPNDCDRAPVFVETETTEPITLKCPKCNSPDLVQRFQRWGPPGHKCVDCKHVF